MSYCRHYKGPDEAFRSDVYVFPSVDGVYECCICALQPCPGPGSCYTRTAKRMAKHLRRHQLAGHIVPQNVIDFLETANDEEELEQKPMDITKFQKYLEEKSKQYKE